MLCGCQFGTEAIEERLERVGDIPVVTGAQWQEVIEKSHAPRHPFNPGGRWRGEVTKVALVSSRNSHLSLQGA